MEFLINVINLLDKDINNYASGNDSMTIDCIKAQISSYTGNANYYLIHNGDILDGEKSCHDYRIQADCCLIVVPDDPVNPLGQKDIFNINRALKETIVNRIQNHNCLSFINLLVTLLNDEKIQALQLPLPTITLAIKETSCNLDRAREYLSHTCPVCFCPAAISELVPLGICDCQLCTDCFVSWMNVCVKQKEPIQWTCPVSKDHWDTADCDMMETFFPNLILLLIYNEETKSLEKMFNSKVNIYRLMHYDNFIWCSNPRCGNGFLSSPNGSKMFCTNENCGVATCKYCNKTWTDEHDDRTCEEVAALNIQNNDSDITQILRDFGIQCPKCKKMYLIAKGGCMHFTCQVCRHEFCAGCKNQIFKHSADCSKCKELNCVVDKGLHCHCPRNCFSYLRDMSLEELDKLLKLNNVSYQPEPKNYRECQTMITNAGMQDFPCEKPVAPNFDLCEIHAKEYLTGLINRNHIDPIDVVQDAETLRRILGRENVEIFTPRKKENESVYRQKLKSYIKENLPLPRFS